MGKYNVSDERKEKSKLSKEEWREYTKSVWRVANVQHSKHPAMFPEEIPKRLIKLFSFVGERILDPFCGVSTTGLAALNLNR
ncbi:MAG: DNA methyltransferase, partial [Thermoplasmata archaeon]